MTELEGNIIKSFQLAKKDIYGLYVHIRNVYSEIELLKTEITMLKNQRVTVLAAHKNLTASRTSTKVHADNCAYAKNIKALNRISFENAADARSKGYALCACVR